MMSKTEEIRKAFGKNSVLRIGMSHPLAKGLEKARTRLELARNKIGVDFLQGIVEIYDVDCYQPVRSIRQQSVILNMLQRLAEKVRRANTIQHSGSKIAAEDWAELYQLTNEAFGVIDRAKKSAV
jgi:hypothetical protein